MHMHMHEHDEELDVDAANWRNGASLRVPSWEEL